MALNQHLDSHLKNNISSTVYSAGATSATITGNLSYADLQKLIAVADTIQHRVSVVAGVLTIQPSR